MRKFLLLSCVVAFVSCNANAEQIVLDDGNKTDLEISVYQNMALVKDARNIYLPAGVSELAFSGVAEKMKPESAILLAEKVNVLEQNYDYDLITQQNLVQRYVGKKVKTAVENQKTGETMFSEAVIVSQNYGAPVLKFAYGIDPNFAGRIIFPEVPDDLRAKPTLAAKVNNKDAAKKDIYLMYLTGGLSWDTNYVATVLSDDKLSLKGWVTVNNVSGIDYKNAKINFVAGDVNAVVSNARPMMKAMRMNAMMADGAMEESADFGMPSEQSIAGYHLYNIPFRVDLDDNQTKQLSLLGADDIAYRKELTLTSPLYFSYGSNSNFEKASPNQTYIIKNSEESNLGIPLPAGTVRFYQKDNAESLQFIGENRISHTAKNEELKMNLGRAFDVFANGAIVANRKISDKVYEFDAKIKFTNSGDKAADLVFTQNFPTEFKILKENEKGEEKDIRTYKWKLELPADGTKELEFSVRIIYER